MTYFHILGFQMNIFSAIMMFCTGLMLIFAVYTLISVIYLVVIKKYNFDFNDKDKIFYSLISLAIVIFEILFWNNKTDNHYVANMFYIPVCFLLIFGGNISLAIYKVEDNYIYLYNKKIAKNNVKINYTDNRTFLLKKYNPKKVVLFTKNENMIEKTSLLKINIGEFEKLVKVLEQK